MSSLSIGLFFKGLECYVIFPLYNVIEQLRTAILLNFTTLNLQQTFQPQKEIPWTHSCEIGKGGKKLINFLFFEIDITHYKGKGRKKKKKKPRIQGSQAIHKRSKLPSQSVKGGNFRLFYRNCRDCVANCGTKPTYPWTVTDSISNSLRPHSQLKPTDSAHSGGATTTVSEANCICKSQMQLAG